MVTVRVRGHSGMGKSALVNGFLDGLVERRDALVLRGRSYAHEAVPYKAVDGVIDALSRYLISVPDDDLSVDDAHWGDTDSAALVLELIRPPRAPPLLLTMTCREEEEQASPFLRDLKARCPQHVDMRDLIVGPLEHPEASAARDQDCSARATATGRAVRAQAARGPMPDHDGSPPARMRACDATPRNELLDEERTSRGLPRDRVGHRPRRDDARRYLEIVAVSGRPVPAAVASEASDIGEALGGVVPLLRARRFARVGIRAGREVIEVLHERIRETIVAQLSLATVREHHGRLARALEAAPDPDVEALAIHLFAAGSTDRAVQFAERAAEQAVVKLAFDQPAHLLRLTLDTCPTSSAEGISTAQASRRGARMGGSRRGSRTRLPRGRGRGSLAPDARYATRGGRAVSLRRADGRRIAGASQRPRGRRRVGTPLAVDRIDLVAVAASLAAYLRRPALSGRGSCSPST